MPHIASLNFRPIAQSEGSEVQTKKRFMKFQMSWFSILHHGIYLFKNHSPFTCRRKFPVVQNWIYHKTNW